MSQASKRILLSGSYAPSLINFRSELIQEMVARGHDVHVCAPEIDSSIEDQLLSLGVNGVHTVPLKRTGLSVLGDLAYLRALKRLIRQVKPDLVVSYTIKPNIWGAFAAASAGVTSISMVTGLGYSFIEGKEATRNLVGKLVKRLYRAATSKNRRVVFQNASDQRDFIAAGCLKDASKARIVNGSGVDTASFTPSPLPKQPVFLMIARLLKSKGVREYSTAALKVLASRDDCRFVLAGDLDAGPDCIEQAELDEWIAGGIEFTGWIDDVRPLIREASIYVLPSYREGTPRTVLEAMAMGRPVLSTDVPGCQDCVVNGKTGILVPARDAVALEGAMQNLADNSETRESMGKLGRDFCEEKYDVNKVVHSLMGYLEL